ncbi:hypothetical protein Tco_0121404 [Tanacetum coccineum]
MSMGSLTRVSGHGKAEHELKALNREDSELTFTLTRVVGFKRFLVCLRTCLELDELIKDSGCSKHMTGNESLFSTYKAYDGGNVVFGCNLKGKIIGKDDSDIIKDDKIIVEESLNMTFDESPPPTKLSPLVDDDVSEEEAIENNIKVVNNNNIEDESIEVEEIVNIKESKNHPLEQVTGKPKNVNEALEDECWVVAMQKELNQFVANDILDFVPLPKNQSIIGTKCVHRNKLDGNGSSNKKMEDGIFFNQSKYIKEMLKKFGLKDSKPTKTLMSTEFKLTKEDEADSVDSTKYRGKMQDPLKDGWIDSFQELSTLGTSLKNPLSKGIVHHPRPLNDLKTSTTSSKKAMNHYTKLGNGLNTMNRQFLDLHGPIPGMTPTQALMAIQTMADHSQKWHDGTSSRNMSYSSNTNRLPAVIIKLDNLGCDMKKLKENVHAIQVGCQICEEPHIDNECPLNEEVKPGG